MLTAALTAASLLSFVVGVLVLIFRGATAREVQDLQYELHEHRMAALRCSRCGRPETMGGHVCAPPTAPAQPVTVEANR